MHNLLLTKGGKILDNSAPRAYYSLLSRAKKVFVATKLPCEKYKEEIDIEKTPCPHPHDYCRYRSRCVINRLCREDRECREGRRNKSDNA